MQRINSIFFHNVLEHRLAGDVYHAKQFTANELAEALCYIRSRFEPITIETFLDVCLDRKRVRFSKPPVFLSFDDGHRGTFVRGGKVLAELKVPAVVFTLGGPIAGRTAVPPYLEWTYLFREARNPQFAFRGKEFSLDREDDYDRLREQWLTMRADTYGPFLEELAHALGVCRPTQADLEDDQAYITAAELKGHENNEYLRVASHAMTHLPLTWLTPAQQVKEMRESHEVLVAATSNYCPVVSYPDGAHDAFTRDAAKDVYQFGFAVKAGATWQDPFAYPRQCLADGNINTVRYHFSRRRRWAVLPAKAILGSLRIIGR